MAFLTLVAEEMVVLLAVVAQVALEGVADQVVPVVAVDHQVGREAHSVAAIPVLTLIVLMTQIISAPVIAAWKTTVPITHTAQFVEPAAALVEELTVVVALPHKK